MSIGSSWEEVFITDDTAILRCRCLGVLRQWHVTLHLYITGYRWLSTRLKVTPVRSQWSCCSLALSHQYVSETCSEWVIMWTMLFGIMAAKLCWLFLKNTLKSTHITGICGISGVFWPQTQAIKYGQLITYHFLWYVITIACCNFNGGSVKLQLKSGHGWVTTSYSLKGCY